MRIACLQHVTFEGPAAIRTWAGARGHSIAVTHVFANEPFPATDTFDLLVVLGGSMSANDADRFEWLGPEVQYVERVIAQGPRVLGICLGAQLIAKALGAQVYANGQREIGWLPVRQTTEPERRSVFSALPQTFTALHWHGETFTLPSGATWLARTQTCEHQAFSVGDAVLALQFHLESTPESVEALVQNCPGDLAPGSYVQDATAMLTAHEHFKKSNELLGTLLDRFTASK